MQLEILIPSALAWGALAGVPTSAQEPARELELQLEHEDGQVFAGTLTLPGEGGPHPAALLVSPAGPHGRDELRSGGRQWAALAGELAAVGIGSLRVDNRGVGGSVSSERPGWDWNWTSEDLAADLRGHRRWLAGRPEVDPNRVGLIAHGDGTLPAARVAAGDRGLAFAVLLSAAGSSGAHRLARMQLAELPDGPPGRAEREAELIAVLEAFAAGGGTAGKAARLAGVLEELGMPPEEARESAAGFARTFDTPFHREWLGTDPAPIVAGIELPVLVLNGAGDGRTDAAGAARLLAEGLRGAGAFNARVDVLPDLGHFLADEGRDELDPRAVRAVVDWIADATGLCREEELPRGRGGAPPELWIRSVTVVDVRAGEPRGPLDVRLGGGRILELAGAGTAPARAPGIAGSGCYLVPGLWDAHGHLTFWGGDALARLAAAGVTTVRDMGGDLEAIDRWRAATAAGELFGPRILRAGPFLDGPKPNFQWRVFAETPEEAERAVRELAARGVDFVKVHSFLSPPALEAAVRTARELGLPVAGHAPRGTSPTEVGELGFASLEHASTLLSGLALAEPSPAPSWTEAYRWWCSAEGARAMGRLAERGTCVTPTLVAVEDLLPRLPAGFAAVELWLRDLTRRLHEAGVTILAGTDFARRSNGIEAGAALLRELEILTEVGLTPAEALRAATLAPARALGRPDLGVIEAGAVADLVLVRADPLADVRALRQVEGVCLGGRWYDAEELERIREQARRAARLAPGLPDGPVDDR